MINKFLLNPPIVVVFNPLTGKNLRMYCFIGDVPKSVRDACEKYHTDTSKYGKILSEFYGAGYKTKLCLSGVDGYVGKGENISNDIKINCDNNHITYSGKKYDKFCIRKLADEKNPTHITTDKLDWILWNLPSDFVDDGEKIIAINVNDRPRIIDGISQLKLHINEQSPSVDVFILSEEDLEKCCVDDDKITTGGDELGAEIADLLKNTHTDITSRDISAVSASDVVEYPAVHIYPEDNFMNVKEKIYLASNIPVYRQHLFYMQDDLPNITYTITADGIYPIDIRSIGNVKEEMFGIPIDRILYNAKNVIHIQALEVFSTLDLISDSQIRLYVADLASVTHPIRTQLIDISNDTYQFDLLYYGFIVKYWPALTRICFMDFIKNEADLAYKYPDLAKNKVMLTSIYTAEKSIIDAQYKNATRANVHAKSANMSFAITQMNAVVTSNQVLLNLRNLFDKMRVSIGKVAKKSRCDGNNCDGSECRGCDEKPILTSGTIGIVTEVHAYVEHHGRKYLLRKKHLQSPHVTFPTNMKTGVICAIPVVGTKNVIKWIFINIHVNGKYFIRTQWNDEDNYGFDDIIKIMRTNVNPIIEQINNMGKYVFITGNTMSLVTKNIALTNLSVSIFWRRIIQDNTFKLIRAFWENYMRAKITAPRNVQQFDRYEFTFCKGIYEFDKSIIDRILSFNNQYTYMSDNMVKQKWTQQYSGRIVRMTHRTADVKFEVIDIKEKEFQTFYSYIVNFMYAASSSQSVRDSMEKVTNVSLHTNKLKKLREQDPALYNLRKYNGKKVYSRLCQNKQQPIIYTAEEVKQMSVKERSALTEYWNFTHKTPAFYGCPSKKYPHLGFITNAHPLGYCLPCCNKREPADISTRKTHIADICRKTHVYNPETSDELHPSRHVIGYGKNIDYGRLSKIPQGPMKNLLFNTLVGDEKELNYYIFGVDQSLGLGIVSSVAEVLQMTVGKLINDTADKLLSSDLFNIVLEGSLSEYFSDVKALSAAMKNILRPTFYENEIEFNKWPELFAELFFLLDKIMIFTFVDRDGSGTAVDLFVPGSIVRHLDNNTSHGDLKIVTVIKNQNVIYPIFALDAEEYYKFGTISVRYFTHTHIITSLLFDMLHYNLQHVEKINKIIDLNVVKEFIIARSEKYQMVLKHINRNNLCYAVIVENKNTNEKIYVPVNYSAHISDKIPVTFSAFDPKNNFKLTTLTEFISDLNTHISNIYSLTGTTGSVYAQIFTEKYILIRVGDKKMVIGMTTNSGGLTFYFSAIPVSNEHSSFVEREYDFTDVNNNIMARTPPTEDNRQKLLGKSLYNCYVYQLFVIEFVNYLSHERDLNIRTRLKDLIMKTNFKRDQVEFGKSLNELLVITDDRVTLRNQILASSDKTILLNTINDSIYEFDHITINKLSTLKSDELKSELLKITSNFTVQGELEANMKFPNIYLPCAQVCNNDKSGYCREKKLIIDGVAIENLVDILSVDLMNDLKRKHLLNSTFMNITVDYFAFEEFPSEQIFIYRVTE